MKTEWVSTLDHSPGQTRLQAGEVVDLSGLKWHFRMGSKELIRVSTRVTENIGPDDLTLKYLAEDGTEIAAVTPEVHVEASVDDLDIVSIQFRGHRDASTVELCGKSKPVAFVGPDVVERFSNEAGGPYLGDELTVYLPNDSGELKFDAFLIAGDRSKPALVSLRFWDENEIELLPPSEGSVNPVLGSYIAIRPSSGIGKGSTKISVPIGSQRLTIRPLANRNEAAAISSLEVFSTSHESCSLAHFVEEAKDRAGIIIIDSTAPPLGSGVVTIRPNNMAIKYADLGYSVLSIGYGKLNGADRRPLPGILQANRDEFWTMLSELVEVSGIDKKLYICSSFPSPSSVMAMRELSDAGWTTLYEIRDDMEEFNRVGLSQWYSPEAETLLCRNADHVTTVSPALSMKAAVLSGGRNRPVTIPNAIHEHYIHLAQSLRNLDTVEQKRHRGIVGYLGHLTPAWFDWETYLDAADALPETRFEIIGPGKPSHVQLPKNVHYLGAKKQTDLQTYTRDWTVGLIPFKKAPLTRGVDPNKLFEYCAWGLRTVSAEMGSIEDCPTAVAYHTTEEMISAIHKALRTPWTQSEIDALDIYLEKSTWLDRAHQTLKVVEL